MERCYLHLWWYYFSAWPSLLTQKGLQRSFLIVAPLKASQLQIKWRGGVVLRCCFYRPKLILRKLHLMCSQRELLWFTAWLPPYTWQGASTFRHVVQNVTMFCCRNHWPTAASYCAKLQKHNLTSELLSFHPILLLYQEYDDVCRLLSGLDTIYSLTNHKCTIMCTQIWIIGYVSFKFDVHCVHKIKQSSVRWRMFGEAVAVALQWSDVLHVLWGSGIALRCNSIHDLGMTIDHHYVTLGLKLLNQELMVCNYFQALIIQFLRINKYQGDFLRWCGL